MNRDSGDECMCPACQGDGYEPLGKYQTYIRLVETCLACPEQYDAFDANKLVGYLRLRHGRFTVEFPARGGKLIYQAHPNGDGKFKDNERKTYLDEAVRAIQRELGINPALPPQYRVFT